MVKNNDRLAVALGTFDGFHLGHKMVIDRVIQSGKKPAGQEKGNCKFMSVHGYT